MLRRRARVVSQKSVGTPCDDDDAGKGEVVPLVAGATATPSKRAAPCDEGEVAQSAKRMKIEAASEDEQEQQQQQQDEQEDSKGPSSVTGRSSHLGKRKLADADDVDDDGAGPKDSDCVEQPKRAKSTKSKSKKKARNEVPDASGDDVTLLEQCILCTPDGRTCKVCGCSDKDTPPD